MDFTGLIPQRGVAADNRTVDGRIFFEPFRNDGPARLLSALTRQMDMRVSAEVSRVIVAASALWIRRYRRLTRDRVPANHTRSIRRAPTAPTRPDTG